MCCVSMSVFINNKGVSMHFHSNIKTLKEIKRMWWFMIGYVCPPELYFISSITLMDESGIDRNVNIINIKTLTFTVSDYQIKMWQCGMWHLKNDYVNN